MMNTQTNRLRKSILASTVIGTMLPWSGLVGCATFVGCQPTDSVQLPQQAESAASAADPTSRSLKDLIDETLAYNRDRRILSTERNAAWQVAHGSVAYGLDLPLQVGNQRLLAFEYLFNGGSMRGWRMALGGTNPTTNRPLVKTFVEAGSYEGQGHVDQFLGYLSQTQPPLDLPITIDGQTLTLEDWGRSAQYEIPNNSFREYSWTLIALTNLFPDDYEWKAADGKLWTLEPLVAFEAKQDLTSSPCGGMHRAMGLAHAVQYWKRRKMSFTGGWLEAQRKLKETVEIIRSYQNSDGTFSTNYTARPGTSSDLSTRIGTTGHTLEVLAYALEPEELREPWLEKSVRRLCELLQASKNEELECGGLYHGLAGLRIYRTRVFGNPDS
jgi:hypothetical protein